MEDTAHQIGEAVKGLDGVGDSRYRRHIHTVVSISEHFAGEGFPRVRPEGDRGEQATSHVLAERGQEAGRCDLPGILVLIFRGLPTEERPRRRHGSEYSELGKLAGDCPAKVPPGGFLFRLLLRSAALGAFGLGCPVIRCVVKDVEILKRLGLEHSQVRHQAVLAP